MKSKNDEILALALTQYGVEETVGGIHNATILNYFKEIGHDWVKTDETAWCSAFMNWVSFMTGSEMSRKLNARSWLNIGDEVTGTPKPGDVVVFWRGSPNDWRGHVAIFINYDEDGKHVNVLGGNQRNMVCISPYDKGRILSIRRLHESC